MGLDQKRNPIKKLVRYLLSGWLSYFQIIEEILAGIVYMRAHFHLILILQ